jgi:cytoskeletal protein RodZ
MKSITTLAVMTLLGIIGTLVALNYYVNYYKPQKQASLATKSPVQSDVVVLKDSLNSIPDMVSPVATPLSNATTAAVPTNSTPAKTVEPIKPAPKAVTPAIASIPKSANVTIAPPVKPVAPVKIVPKTIPADAGIASKGIEKAKEILHVEAAPTKGLHYVVIGSFSDEKNAKSALQSYALKNLSIHKDGKLYRLSAGAYPTAAAAKLRMSELQHQSIESIVIQH